MTDAPFLDHRAIQKLAAQTPKLAEILAHRDMFQDLDPITPAIVDNAAPVRSKGYFAVADGRIFARLVGNQEAQDVFGVDAVSLPEGFLIAERFAQIGQIEQAALNAQARAVKLLRAATTMFDAITTGKEISAKERIRIGSLLHTIRAEDDANAARIAAMKAENAQHDRDRKWALRQAGCAV